MRIDLSRGEKCFVFLTITDWFFVALDAMGDLADGQSLGEQLGGLFGSWGPGE